MRILITGAQGQLAYDIQEVFSDQCLIPLSRAQLDICDQRLVQEAISESHPDVVINTAAFTGVDAAEREIAKSFAVNAGGAGHLARACADNGTTLVQLSTDYVYGGQDRQEPLSESDPPSPVNVYGASKLGGECATQVICSNLYLIRTCGLYGVAGASSKNGNFVQTMLRLARDGRPITVVNDQQCTPTATVDIARAIRRLITSEAPYGIYHITNAGQTNWYEFAERIFSLTNLAPNISPTSTEAFGAKAMRPRYSVLSSERYRKVAGMDLPTWDDALKSHLLSLKEGI